MEVKCEKCRHEWETKSKLGIIICASCGTKNKNPNADNKQEKND